MDDTGKRPRLRVINPWHQYTVAAEDAEVQQKTVEDLRDEYRSWLRNGLEESVAVGATTNPWSMASRSSWWREGTLGLNLNERRIKVAQTLGLDTVGELS
jgi:starvation-inducible outer membrane lipoprotein